MYEIHVYTAEADAGKDNDFGYPQGERHALLVFSRQASNTDHDTDLAISQVVSGGWTSVELGRAGTLNPENVNGKGAEIAHAFEDAMVNGSSLVVYRDPLQRHA